MQTRIYCDRCNSTSDVTVNMDDIGGENAYGIPSPMNGLKTFSFVHNDHIVIAEIDRNGSVRTSKTIDRMADDIFLTTSAVAALILDQEKYNHRSRSIEFFSNDRILRSQIINTASQVIMNADPSDETMLVQTSSTIRFEYSRFRLYFGSDIPSNFDSADRRLIVFHQTTDFQPLDLAGRLPQNLLNDITMLFNLDLLESPEWKILLRSYLELNPQINLFDVSNKEKVANVFHHLINELLSDPK